MQVIFIGIIDKKAAPVFDIVYDLLVFLHGNGRTTQAAAKEAVGIHELLIYIPGSVQDNIPGKGLIIEAFI